MTNNDHKPEDDGAVTADQLDVTSSKAVQELDEHRHVINTADEQTPPDADQAAVERQSAPLPPDAYSLSARGRSQDTTDVFTTGTNNVAATFEQFIIWYARLVAPDRPPEETITALLSHSEITTADDASES